MALKIGARVGLGLAPALLALLFVGWSGNNALESVEDDARLVPQTIEVLQRLGDISTDLAEAENDGRGYRLNRDERFALAAQEAASRALAHASQLSGPLQDAPDQQRRLERLQALLTSRADTLRATLALARLSGSDADPAVRASAERGLRIGAEARALIAEMRGQTRRLLDERRSAVTQSFAQTEQWNVAFTMLAFALAAVSVWLTMISITRPLERLRRGAERVAAGDYAHRVEVTTTDETGQVAAVFNDMAQRVEQREKRLSEQDWVKSSVARFTPIFQNNRGIDVVCQEVVAELARLIDAQHVALYMRRTTAEGDALVKCGSFAADEAPSRIALGEGLVGQCAQDGRALRMHALPEDYIRVRSSLGAAQPRELLLLPTLFEGRSNAVVEVATLQPLSEVQQNFLADFSQAAGLAVNALEARRQLEQSLEAQIRLTGDLQRQGEALRETNDELQAQAEQIRASERVLREQQEELRQANEEHQEANNELRQLTVALNEKARQLTEASEYKSQFLANMSHELRTPLNSLLILSKLLADNPDGTLTPKHVEYAQTIHEAGNDLLALINEVLDLAKIESGTVRLDIDELDLKALARSFEQSFRAVARSKGIEFDVVIDPDLPDVLSTDSRRVGQILKNLLSNAVKFTEHGGVELAVRRADRPPTDDGLATGPAGAWIGFSVRDSGIGIAPERQQEIFDAFRQIDSGLARKYGGTGLGLSISRKLATMLGGSIELESEPGRGSTFTLVLPLRAPAPATAAVNGARQPAIADAQPVAAIDPIEAAPAATHRHLVAVVGDDLADIVHGLAHTRQLATTILDPAQDVVAACRRGTLAAVVLDATLGDPSDAWVTLGRLKQDPALRHVPVHVIGAAGDREKALLLGAHSFLAKPPSGAVLSAIVSQHLERLSRAHRRLLVVEDDPVQRRAVIELMGNGDVHSTGAATGAEALAALERDTFDCVILDLGLPDMDGAQVLTDMTRRLGARCPPVLVYTGRPISKEEESNLRAVAETVIVKGVRSPERLLHETAILLGRLQARLPKATQQMIERARRDDPVLSGRKILVVDDDIRNVFAITAALEDYGVSVLDADSGTAAIERLEQHPDTELVLMDVMMPGMDGLEATRRLRAKPQFAKVPIIVITAKAMPGDREQCLAAGASDYLTKPLDMERLKATARAWLVT